MTHLLKISYIFNGLDIHVRIYRIDFHTGFGIIVTYDYICERDLLFLSLVSFENSIYHHIVVSIFVTFPTWNCSFHHVFVKLEQLKLYLLHEKQGILSFSDCINDISHISNFISRIVLKKNKFSAYNKLCIIFQLDHNNAHTWWHWISHFDTLIVECQLHVIELPPDTYFGSVKTTNNVNKII